MVPSSVAEDFLVILLVAGGLVVDGGDLRQGGAADSAGGFPRPEEEDPEGGVRKGDDRPLALVLVLALGHLLEIRERNLVPVHSRQTLSDEVLREVAAVHTVEAVAGLCPLLDPSASENGCKPSSY